MKTGGLCDAVICAQTLPRDFGAGHGGRYRRAWLKRMPIVLLGARRSGNIGRQLNVTPAKASGR